MSPDGSVIAQHDRPAQTRLKTVDCDVHHALRSHRDLFAFLAPRWRDHIETYGFRQPVPFTDSAPYPKTAPALSRTDAWPTDGGPPGSDLDFMRRQLLDPNNVEFAMLHLLSPNGMDQRNQEFGAALCRAINEWQVAAWTSQDARVKAAIVVPGEDAAAAVAEIEHWAGHSGFVQVAMVTHTIEPMGRRRYWPIFEAAARHRLPLGLHTSGFNGHAITGTGWSSYYVEEQHAVAISQQGLLISMVCEGVFARIPDLKLVVVEAGFAWVPSVAWRLDRHWARMRDEVPHLTRPPSEYIRENVWFTTQPCDEPERPEDLRAIIDWIGWDRLLFATDYPHWDMDSLDFGIKLRMSEDERRKIYGDNARAVYGL